MKHLVLLLALLLFGACQKPVQTPDTLRARLEAAGVMTNVKSQDEAFAAVAKDAAAAKDIEITKQAVGRIVSMPLKDEIAEACALILVKKADFAAANLLARMITSVPIRERTLMAIAKSQ